MNFPVRVLLFGQKAVGKTSLLATIFNHLQNMPAFEQLTAQSEKSHDLEKALDELKRFIRSLVEGPTRGMTPTSLEKEFTFTIGLHGFEHFIDLKFVDMAGETLTMPEYRGRWIELLKESDLIIHAISSPSLMERRDYHAEINKPERFKEYFDEAIIKGDNKIESRPSKRIFLVPIKCEKYLDDPDALHTAVESAYQSLRTSIRNAGYYCYLLPVQTTGCVVFDRFDLDAEKKPVDIYKLKPDQAPVWSPEGQDVLAAHLLDHCMWTMQENFPGKASKMCTPIRNKLMNLCRARVLEQPKVGRPRKFNTCFAPETRILTRDTGEMEIVNIRIGMTVLTQGPSGAFEWQEVVRVAVHQEVPMIHLGIGGREMRVTADHLFRTEGGWRPSGNLEVGDKVIGVNQSTRGLLTQIVNFRSDKCTVGTAYNLYTRRNGNFVAECILREMMSHENLFHLVRHSDDCRESDGVRYITRTRLLEIFPDTPENLLQEGNLLVRHPYLHPRFDSKLLSAPLLYEALKEEAELELCQALMELGATEITLLHTQADTSVSKHRGKATASYGGGEGKIELQHTTRLQEDFERIWRVVVQRPNVAPPMDKRDFFDGLVFNRDNRTLELLFDGIKAGNHIKEFQLEFRHVTARNRGLEAKIEFSYLKICQGEIDFTSEYENNKVERALFNAKFKPRPCQ